MRSTIAIGLLLSVVFFVGMANAAPKPLPLVRVADATLQISVLAPKGWTVTFQSAGVAVLEGARGAVEIRLVRPPAPTTADELITNRARLDQQITASLGPKAVTIRGWRCVSKLSDARVAQGVCMKLAAPPHFDILGVAYQASGAGTPEFDNTALVKIGDGAKGFDPTRTDPRDDRAAPIKLVKRPVPGTKVTVLAPADWRVSVKPDGVLLLTAPSRADALGLTRQPDGAYDKAWLEAAMGSTEVWLAVDDWTCAREAAVAACFHLDGKKLIDLRLDVAMTDADQLAWIRGALGQIGGSVPASALQVVMPPPEPPAP